MTTKPTSDPTPLTPNERARLRDWAEGRYAATPVPEFVAREHVRRLLATLDAARQSAPEAGLREAVNGLLPYIHDHRDCPALTGTACECGRDGAVAAVVAALAEAGGLACPDCGSKNLMTECLDCGERHAAPAPDDAACRRPSDPGSIGLDWCVTHGGRWRLDRDHCGVSLAAPAPDEQGGSR